MVRVAPRGLAPTSCARTFRAGALNQLVAFWSSEADFLSQADHDHVSALSERLIRGITSQVDLVVRNGDVNGYPGCVNLSFSYVEVSDNDTTSARECILIVFQQGESLLMALKDIALSSGSACTSASLEPSYVLRALGAAEDMAHSSLRFGIGRFTTEAEVDFVIERIVAVVNRLREMRYVVAAVAPALR